jgi:hypothetical protein
VEARPSADVVSRRSIVGEEPYNGNHATNPDPTVKARLLAIVRDNDLRYYHSQMAMLIARFGCD